jgi:hypothetical protein
MEELARVMEAQERKAVRDEEEVGPAKHCPPCHPTHFDPNPRCFSQVASCDAASDIWQFLESSSIL